MKLNFSNFVLAFALKAREMLRYAKGESDKSAGMAEMSEDMCNQSAEMLQVSHGCPPFDACPKLDLAHSCCRKQELSGLNGDAHQMSHMSMEESFDLDSRLSLGVGKEKKKSVKWLEDPQQSGENEATSFLRDRELEREECLRALADQERTIELAAQAAWEKELTTASGLGEAGPVDEEVGSSFDDEDEDANTDADECGGAAGRVEDTNVATQADARAGDDLGMTSESNWSSDVETSSLELVKIAAPCSQHYNANDHPLISAKQNEEPLSPDEEAAVTADSSEHTGFGAMDGSSPILAVAVAKGTYEDHPTHKEPRVGALEQPSHELGSDAGAFLRPAHSPAPSPGLTSTAAEWIRRASSGNTSEEEEDARGKTATTRRLDRAEPLSAIVKGDPASPHYLGRENAGGEDKSGVQAYLQVCFDMRTTPISKVCRPGGESLTRLDLAHRGIGNRGATALAALLRVNATLTDVVLDDNNLSSDGAAALFAAMAQANVVKTLRMAANSKMAPAIQRAASSPDGTAADSAGDAAGRAASGSGSNTLGSWEGGAVPGGAGGLASWLARENASLETLDLSKCRLGDSGIKAIASALEANGNDALAALHLGDNDVSDEGAGVLFSVLARCGNLGVRHLDLRWNRLKDASHIRHPSSVSLPPPLLSLSVSLNQYRPGVGG